MNSEINGRRYQPICRTVVPSFFFCSCPTPALPCPRGAPRVCRFIVPERERAESPALLAGYQSSCARARVMSPSTGRSRVFNI